jgi:hypothetical protein
MEEQALLKLDVFKSGDIKKRETNAISKHVQASSGVHPASISKATWVPSWS